MSNPTLGEWLIGLSPYLVLASPFLLGFAWVLLEDLRHWLYRRFGFGKRQWWYR